MSMVILHLVVSIAVFIGGMIYLKKAGFDESATFLMLAGMSGINTVNAVTSIIMSIIALSPGGIVWGLVSALIHGFFFNFFIKKSGE